jgi:carboxypeptidase Taq
LFGYFPTYTLGALASAQIFAAARAALPALPGQIASGDVASLNGWLRERIWGQGCLLETPALVASATGAPLSAAPFERHLRARYLS